MSRTAIVAMSCLFPGAQTPEEFWARLMAGEDLRTELDRLPEVGPGDREHQIRARRGGFVDPPSLRLDGLALPAEELEDLDRVFTWPIHVVRQALEQVDALDRSRCGLVLGNYTFPTATSRAVLDPVWTDAVGAGLKQAGLAEELWPPELAQAPLDPQDGDLELWPGGMPARLAGIALGLGGPQLCLDAACASSLYAIDLAIRRLASGEVDTMVAGGVCVPDEELIHLCFSDLHAYPADGYSQPFDARSKGILTGQGAAAVVLKRLDDAVRDGDEVLGVIEGIGLSNDGRGRHLLQPSAVGQVRAYDAAYRKAGVDPTTVDYVECHATGTPLGDRTELQGLADFWVERHGHQPRYGSVKSNVSHLLTVAGMSSLLKVVLSLRHGAIPPTPGVVEPLTEPRLDDGPVRSSLPWPAGQVRRAGVSAFGFGGTNAHLILSDDVSSASPATPAPASRRLAIAGIGLVTSASDPVAAVRRAQRTGEPVPPGMSEERLRGLASPNPGDHAIDRFVTDPLAMRIPPNDLRDFNSQHLVLMNAARDCLLDAGVPPDGDGPRHIGLVIAAEMELDAHGHGARYRIEQRLRPWLAAAGINDDVAEHVVDAAQQGVHDGLSANEVLSYIGNLMASRIASRWNLTGPAFTVSGDSTVGVAALDIAADLLADPELEGVVVGGVDLASSVAAFTSRFEPADGAADGACCLFLRRPDSGRAYAHVEATASVGVERSGPVSVRTLESAAAPVGGAATAALHRAGWAADDLELLDSHGPVADLAEVFADPGRTAVTSTAAVLGDSLVALPLTSVAATALALHDALLPATPASMVDQPTAPGTYVADAPRPWLRETTERGRRALVTARGVGATAAAVALSGADLRGEQPAARTWGGTDVPHLLPIAADTVEELVSRASSAATELAAGRTSIGALARTNAPRLAGARHRLVIVGRDRAEVVTELGRAEAIGAALAEGRDWSTPAGSYLAASPIGEAPIAFVFPGAFNSYVGLARDLFDAFPGLVPEFETATRRPAQVLRTSQLFPTGRLDRKELMRLEGALLHDIPFMLASGTSVSLLHTMLLGLLGVRADGAFGYSLGESSMMFAMGGWDPDARDDARISGTELFRTGLTGPMRVVREAWRLPETMADSDIWATYVVLADPDRVRAELPRHNRVFLTHVNSPGEVVVAGAPDQVAEVIEALGARAARAPANHVMHCPLVDPVIDGLADLNRYPTRPLAVELLSAYDYERVPDLDTDEAARRIARTLRSTIDFPRLVETAYARGYRYFLEVGPGGTCTRWVGEVLRDRGVVAAAMDRRGAPAGRTVAGVVARLLSHGVPVDITTLLDRMDTPASPRAVEAVCGGTPVPAAAATAAGDLGGLRPARSPVPAAIDVTPEITPRITPGITPEIPTTTGVSTVTTPPSGLPDLDGRTTPLRLTGSARRLPLSLTDTPADTLAGVADTGRAGDEPAGPSSPAPGIGGGEDEIERAVAELRRELELSEELLRRFEMPGPTPPAEPPVRLPKPAGVVYDAEDLLTFATGRIADVFGPEYAEIDGFRRRVRLPAPPYHFVTRVTELEATLGERGSASITTEYDVPADAWFAVDGQVPPAVTIEAGQCDLLLASFLGIDLDNRGDRVYRLLDSSLTFLGDLPRVGQTLRYEIVIDRFVKTPGPTLFFFHYDCYADGEPVVELRNGCAGFFTDDELEASIGVVTPKSEEEPARRRFTPLARNGRETLGADDLRRLSDGEIAGVFGREYDQGAGVNPSVRLAPADLLMVDAVDELAVTGGTRGLGRVVARKRLDPEGWYFTSHFTDDPVLPGSLVAEGAVQLLQTYAMAQGLHLVLADARFQPVPGVTTSVQVRGQVLPRHPEIRYEVDVTDVGLLPRPYVIADVMVYVDGKPSVRIADLGIRLVEKPGTSFAPGEAGVVDAFLGRRNRDGEAALLNEFHMAHAAKGDLAVAMGPEFGIYAGRRAPYIPNGDFLFVDRVMRLEGTRGKLEPGAVMETEYDVPADAWYLAANGAPVVPNCVLMESSLQSAILLGYYLGATLAFPDESFRIRNLDGTATITRRVDLRGKTVRQRSVMLASIPMPGAVLQKFSYELSTDGEVFYRGESMFGYFNDNALANQLGLDNGSYVAPWIDGEGSGAPAVRRCADDFADRLPALAGGQLDVTGAVDLAAGGGRHGLGYARGTRAISPQDWYFTCHFHTDPVMPGSLGVEAMIGALEQVALEVGITAGIAEPIFAPAVDVPLTWRYRGQIPHEALDMSYEVHVSDVRREPDRIVVVAEGSLWRPGLRIYEVSGLAIEIRTGKEL